MRSLDKLQPGDAVGVKSGTGIKKKIYKITKVLKVTPKQIVVIGGDRYWRDTGTAVGGLAWLVVMTPAEQDAWYREFDAEEARKRERVVKRNPADYDDAPEAALRSLRDKTRSLCEKLQADVEDRLARDSAGAMQPHWWGEYLQVLMEMEHSEKTLASVGLCTTLKPASEQSSLFR